MQLNYEHCDFDFLFIDKAMKYSGRFYTSLANMVDGTAMYFRWFMYFSLLYVSDCLVLGGFGGGTDSIATLICFEVPLPCTTSVTNV